MECLGSKIQYVCGYIGKNNRWDGWDDIFIENNSVWWICEFAFEIVFYVLSCAVGGDWGMLSLFVLQSLREWWYVMGE